ncbi:MAG: DUF7687 domain-containing protein [Solirubrobacteraceae bacterium]
MHPIPVYQNQRPEFWALVKLVSPLLGYSIRKTRTTPSRVATYEATAIAEALEKRQLDPAGQGDLIELVAKYSTDRARLMEEVVRPNLMDRGEARELFEQVRDAHSEAPHSLISLNKQKGDKRHEAYLTCIVNILTWSTLTDVHGEAHFDHAPRGPLTFSHGGMPLRTLFRWMDGAFPSLNHPYAAWEIKEYYGTVSFGSRVADGVYETALDGYELNDLRGVGVDVKHYLFLDDRFTWWDCGKSYVCRIVDMLHSGLLDGALFGREVLTQWPTVVRSWPKPDSPGKQ